LLISVVSPAWIIGLDALTFAAVTLRVASTSVPDDAPSGSDSPAMGTPAGLRVFRRFPELLGLLVVTWFFNAFFGPVEVALPMFVVHDLRAGAGILGAYWAAFGVGALIGALAVGAVRRLPLWTIMLGIIAGHGICMLPFAWQHHWGPSLAGFALAGVIYGPYSALSFTLLQERAPATSLTTVLAARSAVLLTASPVGAAAGGFLVSVTTPRDVLIGCGLAMIILALVATFARLFLNQRRPHR
jgi:MFS family permease